MGMPLRQLPEVDLFAPDNAMLDLAETALRMIVELGLSVPMRARIGRFAELAAPPPPTLPPPVLLSGDQHLRAVSAAAILRRLARARKTGPGRGELESIAGLLAEIAGQRSPSNSAPETTP